MQTCTKSQPFIKPAQVYRQLQWSDGVPGCRGNAVRMDGVNGNGQEAAEQLQVSSAPVAGETGTGQLSCCFCGFYLLAAARVICLPLWGWIATKELKKQLLCQQRVGSLKASELQERKLDDQRAESTHEISPCFTHAAPSGVSRGLGAFCQVWGCGGCLFLGEVPLQANPADEQALLCGHSGTERFSFSGKRLF